MESQPTPSLRESDVFRGELAPSEHLVRNFSHEQVLLDALTEFVSDGITSGGGVIVIATPSHLLALEDRLDAMHAPLDAARSRDQYITLDAEAMLARFMENGWPNGEQFRRLATDVIRRARGEGRRVRAFGEMIPILWARGYPGAAVQLEHLWHEVCRTEASSLFCAYPNFSFTQDADESVREICSAFSRLVTTGQR